MCAWLLGLLEVQGDRGRAPILALWKLGGFSNRATESAYRVFQQMNFCMRLVQSSGVCPGAQRWLWSTGAMYLFGWALGDSAPITWMTKPCVGIRETLLELVDLFRGLFMSPWIMTSEWAYMALEGVHGCDRWNRSSRSTRR